MIPNISLGLFWFEFLIFGSDFTYVGNGWCRPDGCDVAAPSCRLNGYVKDDSSSSECKLACSSESSCTGYAISIESHTYANRCYIYGKISSENFLIEWNLFRARYFDQSKNETNRDSLVRCFRRNWTSDSTKDIMPKLFYLSLNIYYDCYCILSLFSLGVSNITDI